MKWGLLTLLFFCFAANAQVRDTGCAQVTVHAVSLQSKKNLQTYKVQVVSQSGYLADKYITDGKAFTTCLKPDVYEVSVFKDFFLSNRKQFEITSNTEKVEFTIGLDSSAVRVCRFFYGIYFETKECVLSSASKDTLLQLVKTMNDNLTIVVGISAHTDCKGSAKKNMKLTECYGSVVKNYLIDKGIDPGRLVVKALGETELLNKCKDGVRCTKEEHAINRRVDFKVIRNDYKSKEDK